MFILYLTLAIKLSVSRTKNVHHTNIPLTNNASYCFCFIKIKEKHAIWQHKMGKHLKNPFLFTTFAT